MDANGNYPTSQGGLTPIINAEKVCSDEGYFKALSVGECDVPEYTLPTVEPTENQIIATRSVFILGANVTERTFTLGYSLGAVFKPNAFVEVPQGVYNLEELIDYINIDLQIQLIADIPGGVLTRQLIAGKLQWEANLGITLYSGVVLPPGGGGTVYGNLNYRLGSNGPATGNPILYPELPRYYTNKYTQFINYQFDDGGTVYEAANLTLRGNLIVDGQIVENLRVEDGIIEAAFNQTGDTITSGVGLLNTNNTNISGLFRDKDTKKFSLLDNVLTSTVGEGLNVPSGNATLDLTGVELQQITGKGTLLSLNLGGNSRLGITDTNLYAKSPDLKTELLLTNAAGELIRDGTTRIITDSTETVLTPPNDLGYIYIDNNSSGVVVDDGANSSSLSVYPTTGTWNVDGVNRLNLTASQGALKAVNQDGFYTSNTESTISYGAVTDRVRVDGVATLLRSPDQLAVVNAENGRAELVYQTNNLTVTPTEINATYSSIQRATIDGTTTQLKSPNQNSVLTLVNNTSVLGHSNNILQITPTQLFLSYNAALRVEANATTTQLKSPDQNSICSVSNSSSTITADNGVGGVSSLNLTPNLITLQQAGESRLFINATQSGIYAPDGATNITAQTDELTYYVNGPVNGALSRMTETLYTVQLDNKQRITFNTFGSSIFSPDSLNSINCNNTDGLDVLQAGVSRLQVNPTDCNITAPNNTEELKVSNNGLFYTRTGIPQQSVPLGAAVQITDVTVSGVTTETSILSGGIVGSLIVPPNIFKVGDSYHAKAGGIVTAGNGDTIQIKLKSGAVVLADSGLITFPAAVSGVSFEIEVDFTIRALGGVGVASINTNGDFEYNRAAPTFAREGLGWNTTNNTTFNTTISNTLDITIQHSTAGQSLTCSNFRLTQTY